MFTSDEPAGERAILRLPQMPKKAPRRSEKNEANMYTFTQLGFNVSDVQDRYHKIKRPLTLFAPYITEGNAEEEEEEEDEGGLNEEAKTVLDRPVTPIDEEIKKAPSVFSKLAKLVRRRISPNPEVAHMEVDDQQELAAVIMGELNGIWTDFTLSLPDPFLSDEENRELNRRTTVHLVTVCDHLFNHYIAKAQILNKRGVFSSPANVSRLKAQLMLDANKFLTVRTVRRYIAEDMRKEKRALTPTVEAEPSLTELASLPTRTPTAGHMTHRTLIDASRPKSQQKRRQKCWPAEMSEMQANMPTLDSAKLLEVIANLPGRRSEYQDSETNQGLVGHDPSTQVFQRDPVAEKIDTVILKRCNSMPRLELENLLDDIGIEALSVDSFHSLNLAEGSTAAAPETQAARETSPVAGSRQFVADDLRRLVAPTQPCSLGGDDDLPPLIQALTRNARHDGKEEVLREQLRELEAREEAHRQAEIITIEGPKHVQPATVPARMPNNVTVRASDIRVSERVCLSAITLQKYNPVYNDLLGELDPAMVKKLDSNLFLGDEITEVYCEIMKTVPTDHLLLDNEDLVEPCAQDLHLSGMMASAALSGRRDERIINASLRRDGPAPWGTQPKAQWAKTSYPPNGMTMVKAGLEDLELCGSKEKLESGPAEKDVSEFMAHSYALWLLWWKNTITSSDYTKYLSMQDTDYMGVVFHFYNSDDEDDDVPAMASKLMPTKPTMDVVVEQQLSEMRARKCEFQPGMWNPSTVLVGGLGQDPVLEEDSLRTGDVTPMLDQGPGKNLVTMRTKVMRRSEVRALQEQRPASGSAASLRARDGPHTRMSLHTLLSHIQLETSRLLLEKERKRNVRVEGPSAQERLEKVWTRLDMPDRLRLDMAIKYSSDACHPHLHAAIDLWELITDLITKREVLIAHLENFERFASDPNRFFEKGHHGLSVARLEEAKIRNTLYKKIDALDDRLKKQLRMARDQFADQITFQGRPYEDKMRKDRTEMLYWLQEERKKQAIAAVQRLHRLPPLPVSLAQLGPVSSAT